MLRALLTSILAIFLINASLSEPQAWTEAPEAPSEAVRAAELTAEGWRIMNTSPQYLRLPRPPLAFFESAPLFWPVRLSADREQAYEHVCDRPEAAMELFSRAAALDPGLAEAWRGWGRAIEVLDLCPINDNDLTWARWRGLEPRGLGPEKPVAFLRVPSAGALAEAGQKYARAAEAAPGDFQTSLDWGLNLLGQSLRDNESLEKLLAVKARWQKHPEWTDAQALNPGGRYLARWTNQWGADNVFDALSSQRQILLLAAGREQDPARWAPLLDLALATLDHQMELLSELKPSPVPQPLKAKEREILVGSETVLSPRTLLPRELERGAGPIQFDERPAFLSEAARHFQRAGAAEPDPALAGAMIRMAIDLKEREIKLAEAPPEQRAGLPVIINAYPWQDMGQLWLELARTLSDDQQWREALVKAEGAFEKYQAHEGRLPSASLNYRHWLEAVRREKNPDRQIVLAEKLLAELRGIEPPANSYVLADTLGPAPTGADYAEPIRQLAAKSSLRFRVAAFLPDGPYRLNLIDEAEKGWKRALEMTRDNQAGLWLHWAGAYLEMAAAETDLERFKNLLEQAGQKYRQAIEVAPQPEALRWSWACHLVQISAEKEVALQILLLEEALRQYQRPVADAEWERPDFLAELHCRLGWLYQKKSGGGWPEVQKGMYYYALAVEKDGRSRWPDQAPSHQAFEMGLALLALAGQDPERAGIETTRAMRIFRRFFNSLPAESEYNAASWYFVPPSRFWASPAEKNSAQIPAQEFSDKLTMIIADRMLEISRTVNSGNSGEESSKAWPLTELAGLYRHLAWSGMLSPEYRRLYLQRAEKQLRRSLAGLHSGGSANSVQAGPGPTARPEINSSGQALVASELALVLAEWTLLEKDDSARRLQEAEELWRRAAESRPGSDRYARARWAARRGDRAAAGELLRHPWSETAQSLFPAFEEARDDPALAAWKDEAWLAHIWYGFKVNGR